ncbi:MAG: T9SS type A sorting domain-containing protein [Saprospiraceae bacterium]
MISRGTSLTTLIWVCYFSFFQINLIIAQCTSGVITSSHSSTTYDAMLDPDGDGWITETGASFTSGTTERIEFEIIPTSVTGWVEVQDVSEIDSDITPNCGNSDLIQDGDGGDFAYYNIVDPTPLTPTSGDEYILFRFRLAQSPNGNFGYNFLIDTDGTYGASVDVNSICGNMGFEREVQFANAGGKKGISIYDVDGSTAFNSIICSQCIAIGDVQEACAASSGNCATSDPQFITFPMLLSHVGIPSNVITTDFYIAAATASSGNATSVLGGGNVTDMGALDGLNSGCSCTGLTGCALFDCQTNCINVAFVNLPIELLYFSAKRVHNVTTLNWATLSESNNSHFVLEKSLDGKEFFVLEVVEGAGNSFERIDYKFNDDRPEASIIYYRLKQVDFDGAYSYSKAVAISALMNNPLLSIIPTISRSTINVKVTKSKQESSLGIIYNIVGKEVSRFYISAGLESTRVDISAFETGHYFVQMKINNNIISERFVKITE